MIHLICKHGTRLTLMSGGIVISPSLQEAEEILSSALLKETHERALDGFHLR